MPDSAAVPTTLIARTWRGATRAEDAEIYVKYLEDTGFHAFRTTPGNRGAYGFRRINGDRAEFMILSLWESEAAIRRFAGDTPERAVFFPEDDRFLVARDPHCDHFEVIYQSGSASV